MWIKHNLKVFFETSWLKTLYFNIHYFGRSGFRLPVIVARNIKLKKMGGQVILGENRCGKIFLGRNDCDHIMGRGVWANEGTVVFQDKCFIGNGTRISVLPRGRLSFGKEVYLTGEARIVCGDAIVLGADSAVSWNVTIMDTDQHAIYDEKHNLINAPKEICIGHRCWIGTGAVILKGSVLPEGTIVAAGAVISKEFHTENTILGGVNRLLKTKVYFEY